MAQRLLNMQYPPMLAKKGLIVVIDDHPSVRKSLARLLRAAGYKAQTFTGANEVLSANAANHASCLIIDVGLPGMDGFELQRELAAQGITAPAIFISGHDTANRLHAEAMQRGAMGFLRKPFSAHDLLAAIEQGRAEGPAGAT